IVDNLLDNAIKFSPSGGHVLLRARLRQGRLQLSVHDQGQGIAMADRETIFQPYVQLGNPTRDRRHGMGLGLSIVSRAAALLETRVSVQSAPGRGSCFTLSL
ncbi:ATP-binding protein, partial [Acinetobacter baumannii]